MLNELAEHIVSLQEASLQVPARCRASPPRRPPSEPVLGYRGISEASYRGTSRADKEPATSPPPKCKCSFSPLFAKQTDDGLGEKPQETHHSPGPHRKRGPLSFGL